MNIPKEYKKIILDSVDQALEYCENAYSAEEKLYFFTYIFGTINRIMNFICDPLLVFAHQELQSAYNALMGRLSQPVTPNNQTFMGTPEAMITALVEYTKDFKAALSVGTDEAMYPVLCKFANLAYATSGNGFFLYTTGKLIL